MNTKQKTVYTISVVALTLAFAFIALMLFWVVYPYPTTDITDIRILNENNEIAIGEPIELELVISKPNNDRPETTNFLTCDDGNLVTLANIPQNFPEGDYSVWIDDYILPPKVAVGSTCQFDYVKTYRPNPIREFSITASSDEFLVVERES